MLPALHRKLIRDLWHIKGQAFAIALVVASGIATFVMAVSMLRSLRHTMETYYREYRFAEVFAHVKRAPVHIRDRIAAIPGVAQVQARVVVEVNLSVEGMNEPAMARLISVPDSTPPAINGLHLREGRYIEPGRDGEVLVSEAFAHAHGMHPGDGLDAVINGRLETLRIVGIALSPEYVYQIRPGDVLPDDKRFAVMWMGERQLAPAFDMDGAYNDFALTLMPQAIEDEVIQRVDRLTEPYGGLGAYGRRDQPSHQFVSNELRELRGMAMVAPTIFLLVAAFLLNVVLTRLISTQREQVATLKAFGYSNLEVGWHYLQMVLAIVLVGSIMGAALGSWMGQQMTHMYARFFHFPVFLYSIDYEVVLGGIGISFAAGIIGTMHSVRRAARMPPAQAMRPEPPADFRPTLVERIGLQKLISPAARMILRELERRPIKAVTTILGIAMAAAVLVVGAFMKDAIDYVLDLQFELAQRQHATVTLTESASGRAVEEMLHMPGVHAVEPFRSAPVRLRRGPLSRRVGVTAIRDDAELFRLLDIHGNHITLPSNGVFMSAKLGELLNVRNGDEITMEVLSDKRPIVRLPVDGLIDDFSGMSAYMRLDALHRLLGEQDRVSGAYIGVDMARVDDLYTTLKNTPAVAGVALKKATKESFNDIVGENLMRIRMFNILFAVIIAFGVVYNSARISLAERSRELATLRVIGFRRAEVSAILLGELAVLTLIAIPIGLALGYTLASVVIHSVDSELFRIPLVVRKQTFGFAALVVLLAALVSGLVVRRRIDHLDLISVLKTRE